MFFIFSQTSFARPGPESRYASAHFGFYAPKGQFTSSFLGSLAARQEKLLVAEAARLGTNTNHLRLHVHLANDFDAERSATRSQAPDSVGGETIHAVLAGYITDLDPASTAAALLNARWGRPASPVLGRWVARWLAETWKWPSSGAGGGPDDGSFTPLGKPASEVMRSWFFRMAARPSPLEEHNE